MNSMAWSATQCLGATKHQGVDQKAIAQKGIRKQIDVEHLVRLLEAHPIEGMSPRALSTMLGRTTRGIRRLTAAARDQGVVEQIGGGSHVRYRIKREDTES